MSEACRYESDVLHAAASGQWPEGLQAHLAECDDCTAAVAVAPWLDRFAKMSDREHILPDPSFVWLKARLLRGSADVSRATRPLNVIQMLAYASVAAGWAALLTWKWEAVQIWLRVLTPSGIVQSAAHAETLSLPFIGTLLVLASITLMLALHTILAEE